MNETGSASRIDRRPLTVDIDGLTLAGDLALPDPMVGVVVFAHGSGSSRLSPRNAAVAETLNRAGLATFLFDLLSPREAEDRAAVFDIPLLARRLEAAAARSRREAELAGIGLGLFGASTGAAAALKAAENLGEDVRAVVSRGGRPDLAADVLGELRAPTLLIVGERDPQVLELNRAARERMRCESALEVVPGATHLFEEPGALEIVARLATDWFRAWLPAA